MCLFLHVLHPFRDLVWLRLEGPPPGPAISVKGEGELAFSEGMKEVAQCWCRREVVGVRKVVVCVLILSLGLMEVLAR
jgi:hypothetical protein